MEKGHEAPCLRTAQLVTRYCAGIGMPLCSVGTHRLESAPSANYSSSCDGLRFREAGSLDSSPTRSSNIPRTVTLSFYWSARPFLPDTLDNPFLLFSRSVFPVCYGSTGLRHSEWVTVPTDRASPPTCGPALHGMPADCNHHDWRVRNRDLNQGVCRTSRVV